MNQLTNSLAALAIALTPAAASAQPACTNDAWNRVMERGRIVVGVKADYKPWGFRDTDGSIIGMEPDLARLVADSLGVDLELTAVVGADRMQMLQDGQIDLMIATMTDRPDRREMVGIVGPNYYASGTNVMARKTAALVEWIDLFEDPVCGIEGAFYNQVVTDRYGARIVTFAGTDEAKEALRRRECIAFVFDDSAIASDIASGNWDDYEMPLHSEDIAPWGLAVPKGEETCVFGTFMKGMQYQWHLDGTLIRLEEKWGIKPSAYLTKLNDLITLTSPH